MFDTREKQPSASRIVNSWGRKEKQKRALDMGLSELVMPPVTRQRVATYRVIQRHPFDPSTTHHEPADPQTVILPGTYKFFDKGSELGKQWKIMQNLATAGEIKIDPVTQKQVIEDVIELVEMHNGYLKVNIEVQFRLYIFMELHPFNRSNKFRQGTRFDVFERTDLETNKSAAYKMAEQDLGFEAERVVMNMAKDEVIGYATTAQVATMESGRQRAFAEVKSDLRAFAHANPRKFFEMANDVSAAVRMNVLDALSFGILEYDSEKKRFIVPYTDEPVFVHLAGEDPNETFIKYLINNENKDLYQAIVNMLEYWER